MIKLKVWGDYACFTRPEMKAERVSYDVMTPSAARGILEAIYWKPAIRWIVDRIHILKPIKFNNFRRNELKSKTPVSGPAGINMAMREKNIPIRVFIEDNRQQRASLVLRDVEYIIEAHFELTTIHGESDNSGKHQDIFKRRARKGQYFHHPYMGCREFPADFELVEEEINIPVNPEIQDSDLGYMLHDIDFYNGNIARFVRAIIKNGVIDIPPFYAKEVKG